MLKITGHLIDEVTDQAQYQIGTEMQYKGGYYKYTREDGKYLWLKLEQCDDCVVGVYSDYSDWSFSRASDKGTPDDMSSFAYCPICGRKL